MRKRHIYALLFLLPGISVSLLVTFAVFGAVFGALWLWVYGDGVWPPWVEQLAPVAIGSVFVGLCVTAMVAGYVVGRRLEAAPGLNVRHVWLSLVAALLPIGVLLLHQLSVGTLGPKTDQQRCAEHCERLGYRTAGTMPRNDGERTCSCFGERGDREVELPIADLPR